MIVSVTPLGSTNGDAAGAAADVINYLQGRCPDRAGRDPGPEPDLPAHDETSDAVGYYADAMASPGIWMGTGFTGVRPEGIIDPEHLRSVLLAENPLTGEQLLGAAGSSRRAHAGEVLAGVRGPDEDVLTIPAAAEAIGVNPTYLRRIAAATHKARALQAAETAAGREAPPLRESYLDATRQGRGQWQVTKGELRRFVAERNKPAVVIGYDLTFSVPKSVSLLWATANPAEQVAIEAAVTESVRAGIAYLEANAAHVRVSVPNAAGDGRHMERQAATGLLAAAYLHDTSRALDPQLHFHVVAANMAEGPDGKLRALDGRSLFMHAKTAGYLAGAELRHRLSQDLGVTWEKAVRGLADVEGVPREAILEMSRRSREMDEHIAGMDKHQPTSAHGRQIAAYDTRAAKEAPVDPDSLRPSWEQRLDAVGFDRAAIDACYGRQQGPALVTAQDREDLFRLMHGADGVTEHSSTFDRRDVLQFVAQWSPDRLSIGEIEDLADAWLAGPEIVRLDVDRHDARTGDAIRREDGRVVPAIALDDLYTTPTMLAIEEAITAGYEAGRHAGVGRVDAELVDQTLARWPHLGQDQVDMVRAITTSGQRIQLVRGDAGAGKTTAMESAARAWEAAGYQVLGFAVQGTAAEIVADKVKVPSATLESLLSRVETGDTSIGPRTILLGDEASTVANRDFYRLIRAADQTGCIVRLAGDPRQHTAVAAGGAWRSLLDRYPDEVPAVTKVYRQKGEEMADVREALELIRNDDIPAGIDILQRHGRIVEHPSRESFYDAIVNDWYADRLRRRHDPSLNASSAMTDFHRERRDINALARELLKADGTLQGPTLHAGELEFQRGDEVIALEQDRNLRPAGAHRRRDYVHTGERGVVVDVRLPTNTHPGSLVVDFDRRGEVDVPMEYLTRRLERGIHGALAHSYVVTTHSAEGDTYNAAHPGHTYTTDPKAFYTAITRAEYELRGHLFSPAHEQAVEHPRLPRMDKEAETMATFTRNMASGREELLASEIDPNAARVAALRSAHSLPELDRLAVSTSPEAPLAGAARRQTEQAIAVDARLHPPADLLTRIGPRPERGAAREPWDDAVGRVAVYRARHSPTPVADGPYVAWALGPVPAHPAHQAAYQEAGKALLVAEQAALARRPTADLARERAELRVALQPPTEAARQAAATARAAAAARAAEAATTERQAQRARDAALHPTLRRPNPARIRAAEETLDHASAQRLAHEAAVRVADQRVRAFEPDAVATVQLPLRQRLERIDGAIATKVRDAVATPAPYLSTALGVPPRDITQRGRWNEAARQIETWRHAELGLGPADGALGPDGLSAALGPVPTDPAQALRRDLLIKQLPIEFQPQRTVERALEGPALSLD